MCGYKRDAVVIKIAAYIHGAYFVWVPITVCLQFSYRISLLFQECHGKVNNVALYSLFVASLAKVVKPCMATINLRA